MTFFVFLCGLGNKGEVRPVFVKTVGSASIESMLEGQQYERVAEQVYLHGQNDIQNSHPYHDKLRSVSMDDVIVIPESQFQNKYFKVLSIGLQEMPEAEALKYIASFR